jgi:hypothetical protein
MKELFHVSNKWDKADIQEQGKGEDRGKRDANLIHQSTSGHD